MSVHHMHTMLMESGRKPLVLYDWNYRWGLIAMWALATAPRSARAASHEDSSQALN